MSSKVLDVVAAEAEGEWGVPRRVAVVAVWAPLVGGALLGVTRAHSGLFRFLTAEDSVIEWLQVVGFAAAAVFGTLLAGRMMGEGQRWVAAAFAAFSLACIFIAGEEISWGQRLLGIETPESFAEINKQGETTLHNIDGVLVFFNLGMLVVGFAGAAGPWLFRRRAALHGTILRYLVPPLFLSSAFFVMFAYKVVRFTVLPESRFTIVKLGEWAELCLAAGLAVFAWLQWRRAGDGSARDRSEVASDPASLEGERRRSRERS